MGPIKGPRFSWVRDDLECKLGLPAGRFTRVNHLLWMLVALVLTAGTYAGLYYLPPVLEVEGSRWIAMFTERGPTQFVVVFFTYWFILIMLVKWQKTGVQRKPIEFTDLVPHKSGFVLSPDTVDQVLSGLRQSCDDPGRFFLLNRIDLALSNLRNVGQIADVDDVLQSQADNDDDNVESSYSLAKGLIWAVPVLGFIGTVMGLSAAIGGFGSALAEAENIKQLKPALQGVTGGLSTAFDTTFVALTCALCMQLLMVFVRKGEEELLDACKEFCQRYVVARLRLRRDEGG